MKFSVSDYRVERLENFVAQDLVVKHHYLHRKAPCSHAFGLFNGCNIVGVIMYGTPSSAALRNGICGPEHSHDVIELTRLWVSDKCPRNSESFLIGRTLRLIDKPIVVSYADASVGHIGFVYQATNWIYTGLSAKRTNWHVDGLTENMHSQTIADKYSAAELREMYGDRFKLVDRPRKHRYVMFVGDKRTRKKMRKKLRYPTLDYPKGAPND